MPEKTMINDDPIKIMIPVDLYERLRMDARIFEIFKNEDDNRVTNSFLSKLITGYFERYRAEIDGQYRDMQKLLSGYIEDPQRLDDAIRKLIVERAESERMKIRKEKTRALSIRPTAQTDTFISEIRNNSYETDESQAEYYRRMFYSYTRLPIYEREKIIHHEKVDLLTAACREHHMISFSIRNRKKKLHRVIPYELVHSFDERHNYLLGQEYDEINQKQAAVSFRLSRIMDPRRTGRTGEIDDVIRGYLERMKECGPQHMINEDLDTCIELSEAGRQSYRSIYNDRPIYYRADPPDREGKVRLYFRCSLSQLQLYFRRFNPGEARVIYPQKLAEDLKDFHRKHLELADEEG